MERVKVYRGSLPEQIWIHPETTPIVTSHTPSVHPRLESRDNRVLGYTGGHYESRNVYGKYGWIPYGKVVECYYDKDQGILL